MLKAALGGAVTVSAVGGVVRWQAGSSPGDPTRKRGLVLAGEESGLVDSVEVHLDDIRVARRSGATPWATAPLSSTVYSMVALTWDDPEAVVAAEVRTRTNGSWDEWRPVPPLHDRPDGPPDEAADEGAGEVAARGGTDLVWVGPSDGVQVRGNGARPSGLRLLLLQPWAQPADALDTAPSARVSRTRSPVPRPEMRGRRRWGARESWRDGSPRYNRTIQQVHVHHTANSNDYGRHDVPGLIRGMYRYHTHTSAGPTSATTSSSTGSGGSGWAGQAGRSRRCGAPTPSGFNATSTGISVIGNFETATPTAGRARRHRVAGRLEARPLRPRPAAARPGPSEGSDKYRRRQDA